MENRRIVSEQLSDHVRKNREAWDQFAPQYVETGERNWATSEPTWGIFDVPENRLRMLPDDANGLDAVELGCGTAAISAWLARNDMRPVGIDFSRRQLATAEQFQKQLGPFFELVRANAEAVPYDVESFDLAIIFGALGLVLVLAPEAAAAGWPWSLQPVVAGQLYGCFFLTFAVGAVLAARETSAAAIKMGNRISM